MLSEVEIGMYLRAGAGTRTGTPPFRFIVEAVKEGRREGQRQQRKKKKKEMHAIGGGKKEMQEAKEGRGRHSWSLLFSRLSPRLLSTHAKRQASCTCPPPHNPTSSFSTHDGPDPPRSLSTPRLNSNNGSLPPHQSSVPPLSFTPPGPRPGALRRCRWPPPRPPRCRWSRPATRSRGVGEMVEEEI